MRTTAILFIVSLITLPMIFSVRISADKFTEIQNEIKEFCNSITLEQQEADERYNREKLWCEQEIKKAEELVEKRKKEVAALEDQVEQLRLKIEDNQKAIQQYADKIAENNRNMAEYKTQRCDANFNYISLLREHYDSEDMLRQLQVDLDAFLDKKIENPTDESITLPASFIERVSAFGHLIPAEHQTALIQTIQAVEYVQAGDVSGHLNDTANNHYDAREITDTLHVDNTVGELQAMDHVAHVEPREYFTMLRTKIDNIIAGLLKHLEDSKNDLSVKEMRANEDYAKFMIALEKENAELTKLIEGLTAENVALTAQKERTEATLEEFRRLLEAAIENLERLRRICQEKEEYHQRETARRVTESASCDEALKIFDEVLGTDQELRNLLNNEADLNKSVVIENEGNFRGRIGENQAKDIQVVF